ncbi:hypothetical protein AJ79_08319 [Helicocarpus griseus UAMH5409]|uniref:Altered inheritance of mitochondria protein 11 n=1 Tax=Helicocarpus griseus UAMH5409 TaxID=1447875 RepID=A0A2B7WUA7_9EURO|nr:hypothetical protein AJ79_08319 [Helicocarpus griseus UAMH5409]
MVFSFFSRSSSTPPPPSSQPADEPAQSQLQSQQPQSEPQQQSQLQVKSQQTPTPAPSQSPQSRLSNSTKLLVGGTAFLFLSTLITRRALARKRLQAIPPKYTSAPYHKPPVNGALEALEALNLATINVASVAMIGVGMGMRAFEIETLDDLRRKVRGGLGVDGSGRSEQDVEEELEEWVVSVLDRKKEKEARGERVEGQRGVVNERGKER